MLLLGVLAAIIVYRVRVQTSAQSEPAVIAIPSPPPAGARLVRLRYHHVPFRDLLADLARQSGLRFAVDWNALRDANVTPEMEVSLDSGSDELVSLQIALIDGVQIDMSFLTNIAADFTHDPVIISTRDALDGRMPVGDRITETYPMGDLLRIDSPWSHPGRIQERSDALVNLIHEVVEPGSWAGQGGLDSCFVDHDILVICAPRTMQYEVKELLESLRRR